MSSPYKLSGCRSMKLYTRKEVSLHDCSHDCWIIMSGKVYDVTQWLDRHPGGRDILQYHAGQDATIAFHSFHVNIKKVTKYLKSYCIGEIVKEEREMPPICQDFMELRTRLENQGVFNRNPYYFWIHFSVGLLLETVGIILLYLFYQWTSLPWIIGWIPAAIFIAMSCGHISALGHETGHNALFDSVLANKIAQRMCIGIVFGHSTTYWNYRHLLHHAKTNIYDKDPDITIPFDFGVIGSLLPKKWGQERKGYFPYQYQNIYTVILVPVMLLPVVFNVLGWYYIFIKRNWMDLACIVLYFARTLFVYSCILGSLTNAVIFYFMIKIITSIWWTAITQTNHIPMEVEPKDTATDWVTLQVKGTCNVESNTFIDWFMEHNNFQIEHHLFPTMPSYHAPLVQPHVMALCHKYNIDYQIKPFFTAFKDITKSLKRSGEIWWEEYNKATAKIKSKTN